MNDQSKDHAEIVAGLRALADFLERHPDLPVVSAHASGGYLLGPAEQVHKALGAVHGQMPEPRWHDDHIAFALEQAFPGKVTYRVLADRKTICTPEVVDGEVVWHPPSFDVEPSEAAA